MRIQVPLDNNTNFYFAEIDGEDMTAIIVQTDEGEINMYCEIEQAEILVNQLRKYISKHRLKVVK